MRVKDNYQILQINKKINNYQDYTFIDFGSGYGNILLEYNNLFKKLIGVELNKTSHDQAKLVLNNYKNISLYNTSMEKYKFPNEKIILYMYEPLFELKCKDRDKIYKDVINNLYNNNNKSYIIYIRETTISNVIDNCYYNEDYFNDRHQLPHMIDTMKSVVNTSIKYTNIDIIINIIPI